MDHIDDFFNDAAVNAFANGINVDVSGIVGGVEDEESRKELAQALLESDEMLLSSLLGDGYEEDLKTGKYSHLTVE